MRNLFLFTFLSFFFASITTIAFEDHKEISSPNIVYKLNADLDDLVLNYCSSYDSFTVNKLYSQKKIIDENLNLKRNKKFLVSIKKKPLDPNLVKLIDKKEILNFDLKNIDELDLHFLSENKKDFVKTLLPLISYENQNILLERSKLEKIKVFLNYNKTLPYSDLNFLKKISKKYRFKSKGMHKLDIVNELLELVDVIPNSIVLAQAANESGWGTSRFAKEYNALFGQYTYNEKKGVIPYEREIGKKHLIRHFSSLDKSVESYFKNINTHYAYEKFRSIRNAMHEDNLDIKLLTNALDVYAEDKSYVDTINSIIDSNEFTQFDLRSYIFTSS